MIRRVMFRVRLFLWEMRVSRERRRSKWHS